MERDYGNEIDILKRQLADIKNLLMGVSSPSVQVDPAKHTFQNIRPMHNMHPDARLSEIMLGLCADADAKQHTGAITYLGVFSSGGRQSNWIRNSINTDDLLRRIDDNSAARVLACVGNNERLRLMLALLRGPKTVAQLVEQCGYSSPGQVYHHLKPLLAADLVQEDAQSRGQYVVVPHRVGGIIMVLAGIEDMLDPQYSHGEWDAQA